MDERGEAAYQYFAPLADRVVQLHFDPSKHHLLADGQQTNFKSLGCAINPSTTIRVETTSLGVVEILRVIQCALSAGIRTLQFTYLEPKEYQHSPNVLSESGLLTRRDFALTDNRAFIGVQGFAQQHDVNCNAHHIFFLGFESSRLAQALEQRGDPSSALYQRYAVIGLPAFSPGWENHVLANHSTLLKQLEFDASRIAYCAANSVREAYFLLWEMLRRIGNEQSTVFISPIGTKPHAVATALFLCETKGNLTMNTSLYYDHPHRAQGGSLKIRRWHICDVYL